MNSVVDYEFTVQFVLYMYSRLTGGLSLITYLMTIFVYPNCANYRDDEL